MPLVHSAAAARTFALVAALACAHAARAEEPTTPAEVDESELRRTCQVCRRGTFGFKFVLPVFLPVSAFVGQSEGEQPEEPPQLLQFNAGLRFGFLGQLSLRFGDFTTEMNAAGVGLGSHPVVSLSDKSRELGTLSLSLFRGVLLEKWNASPLEFGAKDRPLRLAFWPYVGARMLALFGSVNLAQEKLVMDGSTVWAEPMLGLETILDPPNGWTVRLLTEVGGFGVGADISLRAELRAEFHFLSWLCVRLGWEFFYLLATPDRQFVDRVETFMYGPVLGIELGV